MRVADELLLGSGFQHKYPVISGGPLVLGGGQSSPRKDERHVLRFGELPGYARHHQAGLCIALQGPGDFGCHHLDAAI
tara:strand:+ start:1647 stop:1880 length:234 start_codon:yes stop_codon:yes gene_type:complete